MPLAARHLETHSQWAPRRDEPRRWIRTASGFRYERRLRSLERPSPLPDHLDGAIDSSRRLYELPADWDDEGAQPIARDTWARAASLLRQLARSTAGHALARLPAPKITPCADGSIDLHWRTPKIKVLVNVQAGDQESDFYAETDDGLTLKGSFRSDVHELGVLELIFARGLG